MRSRFEIDVQLTRARSEIDADRSRWPELSYEQGVDDALSWLTGNSPPPMEEVLSMPIHETAIALGERYTDEETGYEGRAVTVAFFENGCVRVELEKLNKDGEPVNVAFDEQRLVPAEEAQAESGGPRSMPSQRGIPR